MYFSPRQRAIETGWWLSAGVFYGCSKLGSVECLATDISAEECLEEWLVDAGTEIASPKLYVDKSMTGAAWQNERFAVTAVE